MTNERRDSLVAACFWGVAVMLGTGHMPYADVSPRTRPIVIPPDGTVYGMTYGDWSAAWWQYVFSVAAGENPMNDPFGVNCATQQSSGLVFFLVGSITGEAVERDCTVSAGKAIFFPIVSLECSTLKPDPFNGNDEAQSRECAARWANGIGTETLRVTVDGKEVRWLWKYRA